MSESKSSRKRKRRSSCRKSKRKKKYKSIIITRPLSPLSSQSSDTEYLSSADIDLSTGTISTNELNNFIKVAKLLCIDPHQLIMAIGNNNSNNLLYKEQLELLCAKQGIKIVNQ